MLARLGFGVGAGVLKEPSGRDVRVFVYIPLAMCPRVCECFVSVCEERACAATGFGSRGSAHSAAPAAREQTRGAKTYFNYFINKICK